MRKLSIAMVGALLLCWVVTAAQSQDPATQAPAEEGAAEQGDNRALASFEGGAVTVANLEAAVARQSPFMRKRYQDKEALEGLLDKTVRFELLAREAERRGFDERPAVEQAVKQNAVQQLMRIEFDEKLSADSIPEADVKAYYEEHLAEYVRPATRRASHIMVATRDEAKALYEELKSADLRAFRKRAREQSIDDATKLRGGDLRYFDAEGRLRGEPAPSIPAGIAKAAFSLKNTGDLAKQPVKVEGGFSVVMLTGQRPAVDRKLEDADVQQSIRVRLWRERRQDAIESFVADLHKKHKPEVHADQLHLIQLDTEPTPKGRGIPKGFPGKKPGAAPGPAEEPEQEP